MAIDPTKAIRQEFDKARRAYEARALTKASDWARLQAHDRARAEALAQNKQTHRAEFDTRVEEARLKRINSAGENRLEHPAPFSRDRFSPEANARQAARDVANGHAQDQARIGLSFDTQLETMLAKAERRDRQTGRARTDFTRAKQAGQPTRSFNRSR